MNRKLINDLKHLRRNKKGLYFPYLCDQFDVPFQVMTQYICHLHIEKPFYLNAGILTDYDPDTWLQWYIELSSGYTANDGRYKKKRGKVIPIEKLDERTFKYQKNTPTDRHISVYGHDKKWVDNAKKTGSVRCQSTKCLIYGIHLDFDRKDIVSSNQYFNQTIHLYLDVLPIDFDVYHTGGNGYHLFVPGYMFGYPIDLQEKITGKGKLAYNIAHHFIKSFQPAYDPWYCDDAKVKKQWERIYGRQPTKAEEKIVRKQIEIIDANVYNVNSTIRQPFTTHEKTNKIKHAVTTRQHSLYEPPSTKNPPYLLHVVFWNYKEKEKPYTKHHKYTDATDSEIIKAFQKYFPDFDKQKANVAGWVDELYNPHYEDTRPSVSVNIKTGSIKDFGNEDYDMSLIEFVQLMEECNESEAKRIIKESEEG